MFKKLLVGGGILAVVAVVVVVVFVIGNLDSIVKGTVERVGSRATATDVTLDEVSISLKDGTGAMNGLSVANPEGFQTSEAIRIDGISLKIDKSTLTDDVIIIDEVVIDGPQVTYETNITSSNVGTIQANVDAFMRQFRRSGAPGGDAPDAGGGRKMIIKTLTINRGRVNVSATFLGGKKVGAEMAPIVLTNLGDEKNGMTPAEIAGKILDAILEGSLASVAQLDIEGLADGVQGAVKDMGKKATDALGGLLGGRDD